MFPIHQDSLQGFEILWPRRIFRWWGWGSEGVVKPPKLKKWILQHANFASEYQKSHFQ